MKGQVEYLTVKFIRGLVRILPDALVRGLGSLLGAAFYFFDAVHRRVAERNLAAAFPTRSPKERRAIALKAFQHFGRMGLEILKFSTLSPDEMLARVKFDGLDRVRHAYAQGKGVFLYTGHFGYWELHALVHALELEPMAVMARALDNRDLNALLEDIRRRTGNSVIYRQETLRRVLRMLQARHAVAVLIDQHITSRDAVYVHFFDRLAATTSMVASIAIRSGVPVVPCFALPVGRGRYRMIYEHPIEPPAADSEDAVLEFTQRCTDVLEMYVRRHPELWLWMHRRWRDPEPPGEHVRGMFPSAEGDEEPVANH